MEISDKCTEGLTDCQKILLANTYSDDFGVFLYILIAAIIFVGALTTIIELIENHKIERARKNRHK